MSLRAAYSDGVLVPAKAGQTADPKPSAGNDGTIITVRLFLCIFMTKLNSSNRLKTYSLTPRRVFLLFEAPRTSTLASWML